MLAGGAGLVAVGLSERRTEDLDLFTTRVSVELSADHHHVRADVPGGRACRSPVHVRLADQGRASAVDRGRDRRVVPRAPRRSELFATRPAGGQRRHRRPDLPVKRPKVPAPGLVDPWDPRPGPLGLPYLRNITAGRCPLSADERRTATPPLDHSGRPADRHLGAWTPRMITAQRLEHRSQTGWDRLRCGRWR